MARSLLLTERKNRQKKNKKWRKKHGLLTGTAWCRWIPLQIFQLLENPFGSHKNRRYNDRLIDRQPLQVFLPPPKEALLDRKKQHAPKNYPAKSPLVRRDPQAGAVDSPPSSPSSPFPLFPLLLVLAVLFSPTTLLLLLQAPQISESPNPHKDSASLLLPSWSRSSLASFRFLFLSS